MTETKASGAEFTGMALFVPSADVLALEAALLPGATPSCWPVMLQLAWQLRQRDSARALQLCQQLQALLPAMSSVVRTLVQARICLIQGEVDWLFARMEAASGAVQQATTLVASLTAPLTAPSMAEMPQRELASIEIDALILQGWLALDLGLPLDADAAWERAMLLAQLADETLRHDMLQAMQGYWHMLSARRASSREWSQAGAASLPDDTPLALLAILEDCLSVQASLASDYGASITHGITAWEASLGSGQVRRAICAAANIGDDFSNLGDCHTALEWMQRALALARPTGWPGSIGLCLAQIGGTLRRLGRLEEAGQALDEALQVMAELQDSRNYGVALAYSGDLAQDQGCYELALDYFCRLEQRAQALGQADFHIHGGCAQIAVLARLGRVAQALEKGHEALKIALARDNLPSRIAVLKALAALYHDHPALVEGDADPELDMLLQAHALAQDSEGMSLPLDLLDSLALAFEQRGDIPQAFQYTRAANAVREALHSLEAGNRAIAMQVRHKTERARAEGEHHRQLALAEAQRAKTLQQTSAMLAHLGAVGQEITAHLDESEVFLTLNRHVQNLLDAVGFSIYLCDPDGLHLYRAFGLEAGKPLPQSRLPIADPHAKSSRCVREQREILLDLPQPSSSYLPGTLINRTALFAPLKLRERVLGVMSVQSQNPHAYDERALLIFRTLCAYGAIALDNAQAYWRLQEAQAKLVAKEKLAALGALVAGVAHELNTPLGNSLMMASALEAKSRQFEARVKSGQLLLDELLEFLMESREAAILIMRGLASAADLVNSFKQVAVDRTSAQRRSFDLQQTVQEIIATMATAVRQAGHYIELDLAPGICMESYPGPLGQVITNLVNNALLHAFDERSGGHILLSARLLPEQRVLITVEDDGHGIPEDNLSYIFDPFFTTKMGQGGSGLGLSICYNIVNSILNGHIRVQSRAGTGTRFLLELPLVVAGEADALAEDGSLSL